MSSVKYHRPWIPPLFANLIETMSPGTSVGVARHSKVSGLGILFGDPLKLHTHYLTACVYHSSTWLVYDYWRPGALFDCYRHLGLLFPKKSVISVGVDNV